MCQKSNKAKTRRKDEEIRYPIRNQDETRTSMFEAEEARAGNAFEGTRNQASTAGGRA